MKEFNPNLENNGQFKLDLQSESESVASSGKEQKDGVTHLSSDDLLELEREDPVAYEALMDQIEKQQGLEEIEELALAAEAKENIEKNEIDKKKEEEELRASIIKAFEEDNTDEQKEKNKKSDLKDLLEDLYKKDPDEPWWQR